jgi:predicted nucleic acid-binding protein
LAQRAARRFGTDRGDSPQRAAAIRLIVDAGPLYAAFDADDRHHSVCRELLESHSGPLLLPTLVITEVAYLIESRLGAEAETRFVGDLAAGIFVVHPVAANDWLRIAELVWTYRQMSLGTVDASIITLAERLREKQIATLDHRHFGVVRPGHVQRFELLP